MTPTEQDKELREVMSKPDNTQELDEILDEFLTDIYTNNEHFAANQEALDKTKEEPMQAILDWHNKRIEAELEALREEIKHEDLRTISQAITARIDKLKESTNDKDS